MICHFVLQPIISTLKLPYNSSRHPHPLNIILLISFVLQQPHALLPIATILQPLPFQHHNHICRRPPDKVEHLHYLALQPNATILQLPQSSVQHPRRAYKHCLNYIVPQRVLALLPNATILQTLPSSLQRRRHLHTHCPDNVEQKNNLVQQPIATTLQPLPSPLQRRCLYNNKRPNYIVL